MPGDEYLYLVVARCPACGAEVGHAERFDGPIPLDYDVPISAKFCPACGVEIATLEYDWDPQAEHEIARVLPTQEREEALEDAECAAGRTIFDGGSRR